MQIKYSFQRAFFALCLSYLTACSSSIRQWTLMDITTACPRFNSGRMYLEPNSAGEHLELELDRTSTGIRMYLNLFLLKATPWPNNPNLTSVELIVGDDVQMIYPARLQGGQHLLLPEDATQLLIDLLLQGDTCTLKLGRNQITVIPTNFEDCYQQLMQLPIDE